MLLIMTCQCTPYSSLLQCLPRHSYWSCAHGAGGAVIVHVSRAMSVYVSVSVVYCLKFTVLRQCEEQDSMLVGPSSNMLITVSMHFHVFPLLLLITPSAGAETAGNS